MLCHCTVRRRSCNRPSRMGFRRIHRRTPSDLEVHRKHRRNWVKSRSVHPRASRLASAEQSTEVPAKALGFALERPLARLGCRPTESCWRLSPTRYWMSLSSPARLHATGWAARRHVQHARCCVAEQSFAERSRCLHPKRQQGSLREIFGRYALASPRKGEEAKL